MKTMFSTSFATTTVVALTAIGGSSLPKPPTNDAEIKIALSIVFGIVGALSVLFVVLAGVRYMLSGGDPGKTAKAKDGIIYALVGLAIAIFAETIVIFVVGKV
jgi:hypothetical protein